MPLHPAASPDDDASGKIANGLTGAQGVRAIRTWLALPFCERLKSGAPVSRQIDPGCEAARVGLAPLPLAVGAYPDVVLPEIAGSSSHLFKARTLPLGGTRRSCGAKSAADRPAPVAVSRN